MGAPVLPIVETGTVLVELWFKYQEFTPELTKEPLKGSIPSYAFQTLLKKAQFRLKFLVFS